MGRSAAAQLPLNIRVDRIGQHVVQAGLFLDLWLYFGEDRSRRKIIGAMREYSEFFRFTPHAYLVSYVVYIARVFETRPETVNFGVLIREAKAQGKLSPGNEATVDALLASAKPIVRKVAILRNNAFAHQAGHMGYDDSFKLAAVKPSELRDVTNIALKIANHLLRSCELQEQFFTELPREAAEQMMTALAGK